MKLCDPSFFFSKPTKRLYRIFAVAEDLENGTIVFFFLEVFHSLLYSSALVHNGTSYMGLCVCGSVEGERYCFSEAYSFSSFNAKKNLRTFVLRCFNTRCHRSYSCKASAFWLTWKHFVFYVAIMIHDEFLDIFSYESALWVRFSLHKIDVWWILLLFLTKSSCICLYVQTSPKHWHPRTG